MARDLTSAGAMFASPNQASTLFNPDGAHPVRQKHLFVVRFLRQVAASPDWRDALTFVVKSMDRPSVEAVTETVNQYNKKKIIHTGVKYNPINVSFYDTADGAAMNLWQEYASYYFADYTQTAASFNDDLLNPKLNDPSTNELGWGFRIPVASSTDNEGIGSQYFFSAIEVMQLWGNEYTSYQLVNPRITSFTPDDLDYSTSEASIITMNLSFEAISHANSGKSMDLFSQQSLTDLFENGPLNGAVLEVSGQSKMNNFTVNAASTTNISTATVSGVGSAIDQTVRDATSSSGGVLSRFGNFDFGSDALDFIAAPDYLTPAIGGSSQLVASLSRVNDGTASAGKDALSLPNMAASLNQAAKDIGGSPLDGISKDGGLQLSDQVIQNFNNKNDGTFLMGTRKSV